MISYWGNIIEGIFWIVIGVIVFVRTPRGSGPRVQRIARIAVFALALFGISDFVEAQTGAWYRPLGLLAFKAACVVTLAYCWIWYERNGKRKKKAEADGYDLGAS